MSVFVFLDLKKSIFLLYCQRFTLFHEIHDIKYFYRKNHFSYL